MPGSERARELAAVHVATIAVARGEIWNALAAITAADPGLARTITSGLVEDFARQASYRSWLPE